jgi:glycosyltransferase involved in cell wall biosynthesis
MKSEVVNIEVSIICTVKNEEETIEDFLLSICRQTMAPDEIIIVDGGSSDRTIAIVQNYLTQLPIRLIMANGANISTGRNIAVTNSKNEIIAGADGGCKLHPEWLENITRVFEKNPRMDVVSGVYSPWCKSEFEEVASHLVFPSISKLNSDTFLPSSRSIAYKKSMWKEVGGYPEWLKTAEDTYFDVQCKRNGAKFFLATDAIVYWRVRSTLKAIFRQYYNYAKGDGCAFLFPLSYFSRYIAVLAAAVLMWISYPNFYVWLSIPIVAVLGFWLKHARKIKEPSPRRLFIASKIALAIETGVFFGFLRGLCSNRTISKVKN